MPDWLKIESFIGRRGP